jgi:hypothetical protein
VFLALKEAAQLVINGTILHVLPFLNQFVNPDLLCKEQHVLEVKLQHVHLVHLTDLYV